MKRTFMLACVFMAHTYLARALKAPRAPQAEEVLMKEVQVENEALKRRNQQLESMMVMARAEVQRMDGLARSKKHHKGNCDSAEVLNQEIEDLKKKLQSSEVDKNDLVQTLRRMLAKNSTQIYEKQAEVAQQRSMALEMKFGEERQALEAEIQNKEAKVREAVGRSQEAREMAQTFQEKGAGLMTKLQNSQAAYAKSVETTKALAADKANLVATMQALMRDNSRYKHALQEKANVQVKDQKEVAAMRAMLDADEAMLAKLDKKQPKSMQKPLSRGLKTWSPRHHKHEKSSAKLKAHMSVIDNYMDSVDEDSDDGDDILSDKQLSVVQQKANKVQAGTHLGAWLGFTTQAPKVAKSPEKILSERSGKAMVNDGGEAEAAALVQEAKADLEGMGDA